MRFDCKLLRKLRNHYIEQLTVSSQYSDENIQTRVNVHKTLYCLADIHSGVLAIVNNKLVPVLINLIKTEEALVKIWIIQTICKTLRIASEEALDNNGLDILGELKIKSKNSKSFKNQLNYSKIKMMH